MLVVCCSYDDTLKLFFFGFCCSHEKTFIQIYVEADGRSKDQQKIFAGKQISSCKEVEVERRPAGKLDLCMRPFWSSHFPTSSTDNSLVASVEKRVQGVANQLCTRHLLGDIIPLWASPASGQSIVHASLAGRHHPIAV
jgi:hypothetical protein